MRSSMASGDGAVDPAVPNGLATYSSPASSSRERTKSIVARVPAPSSVHEFQPSWIPGPGRIQAVAGEFAWSQGFEVGLHLDTGLPGHLPEQGVDRGLLAGADVAYEAPTLGGGPHECIHDVVDEHEVPGLLTVAEDRHRLPAKESLGEDRHYPRLAVGVLPGPVDVGEGQGGEFQRVELPVGDEIVECGLLRYPIGR